MTEPRPHLLLVDDDDNLRRVTEHHLTSDGFSVSTACNGLEAVSQLQNSDFDLVLTDLVMPELDGMGLLREIRKRSIGIPVIMITAHAAVESAVEAMREGAHDYIAKPFGRDELRVVVQRALEHGRLRRENVQLRETLIERYRDKNLVGDSPKMSQVLKIIGRLRHSDASVLIQGESGTGKELVARSIHFSGKRSGQPFVAVNCSAIPRDLLESVLFGHRRGAFTGATEDREGKFEAARGGSLFLDEIGDMPSELQSKILRVLQEREIERVGSNKTIAVDVRIIAATNRNLADLVELGQFREDLFYRLNVVPIQLPPLRARPEDIASLVRAFLVKFDAPDTEVGSDLLEALMDHQWPGNVRELENLIERMLIFRSDPNRLCANDLPEDFQHSPVLRAPKSTEESAAHLIPYELEIPDTGLSLEKLERALLCQALVKAEDNKSRAARLLGISRQTLLYRLQKHEIEESSVD